MDDILDCNCGTGFSVGVLDSTDESLEDFSLIGELTNPDDLVKLAAMFMRIKAAVEAGSSDIQRVMFDID